MSTTSFPLLDAFTQSLRDFNYDAVTNWSRFFNISPALSLFTYNAGDQEVEQQVIDHVGSYGSQLSTILKMLDVLNRHVKLAGLDKTDQDAEDEFDELFRNSRAVVAKHKGELGIGDEKLGKPIKLRWRLSSGGFATLGPASRPDGDYRRLWAPTSGASGFTSGPK
jgi:hypothetical protein